VRFIAILTNIFMFFVGNPEITLPLLNKPVQVYNLVITLVIFLLFFFFTYTTITTGIKLERKDRKKMLKKLAKQKSAFQGS